MDDTMFRVLFREKPAKLLLTLLVTQKEIYASSIAKKIDCTYSHIVKILKTMEEKGVVIFKRKGRLKIVVLTKKGEEVAKHISSIQRILN
jgi:predicted transcriptional regulator